MVCLFLKEKDQQRISAKDVTSTVQVIADRRSKDSFTMPRATKNLQDAAFKTLLPFTEPFVLDYLAICPAVTEASSDIPRITWISIKKRSGAVLLDS